MSRTDRRRFLTGTAAIAGGTVFAPFVACTGDDTRGAATTGSTSPAEQRAAGTTPASVSTTAAPVDIDPDDPATWRAQFSLNGDAHFAAFTLAAHPRAVADAIDRHRRGLDEDTEGYLLEQQHPHGEAVLRAASGYLDAEPAEIALTDSTTMGLGIIYGGMRLAEGDEIVTTEHDFYATHEALRLRAAQTGAKVTRVRLYDDPATVTVDAAVGRLMDHITSQTRLLAVTWTHSGTGVKLPIAQIGTALADINRRRDEADQVLLCVDAVHAFGVETPTPDELGCHALISGTHKWLFGPRGTGLVWLDRTALARIEPVIPPFEGESFAAWQQRREPKPATAATRLTPGGYHSFEHRWALAEAFDLHRRIGKERVRDHTHRQAAQLKEGLADLVPIRVVTPMSEELSSGIVCIDTPGQDRLQVLLALREAGFRASASPYREQFLRFGPSIVTSPDEVDGLIAALAEIV